MADDSRAEMVGRSGRTYTQWINDRVLVLPFGTDAAVAAMRSEKHAFEREFLADADDAVPVVAVINEITGERVPIEPPQRIRLDDLDAFLAEHQRRFAEEFIAGRPITRVLAELPETGTGEGH